MAEKSKKTPQLDLETLLCVMPDLYLILDSQFKIRALSNAYAKATNIDPEKVLGCSVFEVFSDNPEAHDATTIKNFRQSLELVLQNKIADTMAVQKYAIPRSESEGGELEERFWSPINIPILGNDNEVIYILHRAEDITQFIKFKEKSNDSAVNIKQMEYEIFKRSQEMQEANKRLRESEQRLRIFIDSSKDYAFLILDPAGYIYNWNAGAERIKGYKAEEIVGKHFSIFYPEDAIKTHHPEYELKVARETGRYEEEGWRVRKDGSQFWANVILTPLYDDKARLIGYGKVTRDLTEQRRAEQLKNEFVSVVSHELRTPLTSIRGSLGLVLGGAAGECPDKVLHLLKIANTNCDRLSRLINDILDVEKIEAGKMNFKFQQVDLGKWIAESVSVNQMYADKFNVKIICKPLPVIKVNVDTDRLMQVMTNFISNAVKFSKKGGEVVVSISQQNSHATVSVSDKGMGIPLEFQDKIFQRFSQADSSTTRSETGTGLGLAISKAIIERLGGTIGFKTKAGEGSTFYFDLPEAQFTQVRRADSEAGDAKDRQRILICEDDADQAEYLSTMLMGASYDSEICHTAEQAKRLLEDNEYYALLLDLILPDENGIELIKTLRNSTHNQMIPIIVISVFAKETKELVNGNVIQVVDWLEKPVDFNKLAKAFSSIKKRLKKSIPKVLHIEDDEDTLQIVSNLLEKMAIITPVKTIKEAKENLGNQDFDLAILDLLLPDGNGVELLGPLAEHGIPVIVFARSSLEPQFANQVHQVLIKSETSPQKLLEMISGFLNIK